LRDIIPVSELEKKPESRIRTTKTEYRRPSGASFKAGMNLWHVWVGYLEEKQPG
jgi:hypothetical protein